MTIIKETNDAFFYPVLSTDRCTYVMCFSTGLTYVDGLLSASGQWSCNAAPYDVNIATTEQYVNSQADIYSGCASLTIM